MKKHLKSQSVLAALLAGMAMLSAPAKAKAKLRLASSGCSGYARMPLSSWGGASSSTWLATSGGESAV